MRITLKQNILFMVAVITFSSILGCILLIQNARLIGKNLRVETEQHICAMLGQQCGGQVYASVGVKSTFDLSFPVY